MSLSASVSVSFTCPQNRCISMSSQSAYHNTIHLSLLGGNSSPSVKWRPLPPIPSSTPPTKSTHSPSRPLPLIPETRQLPSPPLSRQSTVRTLTNPHSPGSSYTDLPNPHSPVSVSRIPLLPEPLPLNISQKKAERPPLPALLTQFPVRSTHHAFTRPVSYVPTILTPLSASIPRKPTPMTAKRKRMTKLQQFFGENIPKQFVLGKKFSTRRESLVPDTTTTTTSAITAVTQRVLRAKSRFTLTGKKRGSRRTSRVIVAPTTTKKNSYVLEFTPTPTAKKRNNSKRSSRVVDTKSAFGTRMASIGRKQRRRVSYRGSLMAQGAVPAKEQEDVVSDGGTLKAAVINQSNHQQTVPFILRTCRPVSKRSDITTDEELWSTKKRSREAPPLEPARSYSPSNRVWAREKGGHRVVESNLNNVIHALRAL